MRATLTSLISYHCPSAQTTRYGIGTGVLFLCQESNSGNDALEEFDTVLLLILQLVYDRRINMVRFGIFEPLLYSY